jgi:cysteine desulfurase
MLEEARGRIAAALGWRGTVILTSGASEAIALAVRAAKVSRVEASPFEHDAVMRVVSGRPEGVGPVMRAVQTVNSEAGMILPPPDGDGPWLADCAQSAGKLPLPDADLCVVSGHKLGGPPGIGALLVRDLTLLEAGGGQEQGYRGGTENLPGAMGLAAALEAPRDWLDEAARLRAMLDAAVLAGGGEIVSSPPLQGRKRLATIAAYRMPGVTAAAQLIRFDMAGVAVSAGSACSSGTLKTSPVLAALGLDDRTAGEVIRVSFGWTTTHDDVARFAGVWARIAGARAA